MYGLRTLAGVPVSSVMFSATNPTPVIFRPSPIVSGPVRQYRPGGRFVRTLSPSSVGEHATVIALPFASRPVTVRATLLYVGGATGKSAFVGPFASRTPAVPEPPFQAVEAKLLHAFLPQRMRSPWSFVSTSTPPLLTTAPRITTLWPFMWSVPHAGSLDFANISAGTPPVVVVLVLVEYTVL